MPKSQSADAAVWASISARPASPMLVRQRALYRDQAGTLGYRACR
jgi:hypothetical protein